jgi:hypothetical protein
MQVLLDNLSLDKKGHGTADFHGLLTKVRDETGVAHTFFFDRDVTVLNKKGELLRGKKIDDAVKKGARVKIRWVQKPHGKWAKEIR